jgi:hypothetical protein
MEEDCMTFHIPRPSKDPQAMTARARAYLIIGGTRHLLIGAFMLWFERQFAAAQFVPIVGAFPLWVWAAVMLLAAVLMGLAAWLRSAPIARAGLVVSATVTFAIGVGLTAGSIAVWAAGGKSVPISAILFLSLALKDYAVCTLPIRSPFEPLLRGFPRRARRMPL